MPKPISEKNLEVKYVFFRVSLSFLRSFDEAISRAGYARRSEAIREGMRLMMEEIRKKEKRWEKMKIKR